jgi:hypothetical protein
MKWKIGLVCAVSLLLLAIPASLILGATPENGITSPTAGASVRGVVSIEGTATDAQFWKYELHYNPVPGNEALWTAITGSPFTTAVVEDELGVWDTATVADGTYGLRLRVVRTDGNFEDSVVAGIQVVNTQPEVVPTEVPVTEPEPVTEPAAEPTAEPEAEPETAPAPVVQAEVQVPFLEEWSGSAHADSESEAKRHWDEDDPQVVSASCAKCHSEGGALEFFGADGSEPGVVENDHAVNTVISCVACHNEGTVNWDSVVFPSGLEITGLGNDARCMECHQGRASKVSVDTGIEEAGLVDDPDAVSEDLGFTNIHYYAAAASLYGTWAQGGYQYDGNTYDAKFRHVEGYDTCVSCHSPHTLELQTEACVECHGDGDLKDVRMISSASDYDGDGDVEEGIYYEIEGLKEMLYEAIQAYAAEVSGTPIIYDSAAYPYFFVDTNANGEVDEGEGVFPNQYNAWTPRLTKAAYNYQVSKKDPGEFAHGGKYVIQLLYDSIEDLNEALSTPIDLSTAHRGDAGHFDGSTEAFRHWDEDGEVSGSCARCHSADGLPTYIASGGNVATEPANGFMCATCHNEEEWPALYVVEEAEFPSGATVSFEDTTSNLCLLCHQGRESTVSVDRRIGDSPDNEVAEGLGFANIHYFAAGATLFGDEVMGAYQFDGQEYLGRNEHVEGFATCGDCHNVHELEVEAESCATCHGDFEDLSDIRMDSTDYDGDGDTSGGIDSEIAGMAGALYAAIQAYAEGTEGVSPIEYNPLAYPYFFDDAGERYSTWTPALLRAAYNYQYSQKDPGAYAHNPKYVLQILYDSIEHVGGDVSGMTRP